MARGLCLVYMLLGSLLACTEAFMPRMHRSWMSQARPHHKRGLLRICSGNDDFTDNEFTSLDDLLYSRGVMFVGDGQAEAAMEMSKSVKNGAYLFSPTQSMEEGIPINGDPIKARDLSATNKRAKRKKKRIEIPLLPFEAPLFPGSREFLFIYEMRFRSLMNDVHDSKLVGRCFLSEDDQIGSVGTLCKIVESRKLESGKGFFVIEARHRFRIVSIEQRVPYSTAIVELDYEDDPLPDEQVPSVVKLWNDVYRSLKIYLRIARLHALTLKNGGYDDLGEADKALVDVQSVEIARLHREITRIESRIRNRMGEKGDEEKLMALREAVAGFQQMTGVEYTGEEGDTDVREDVDDDDRMSRFLYDSDEARSEMENSMYRHGQAIPASARRSSRGDYSSDRDSAEEDGNGDDEEALPAITTASEDESGEMDEDIEFLSPEVRDTKPLGEMQLTQMANSDIVERATAFGHAVANLLSTDEYVMQQLLQSTDLTYRLKGLKASLDEALEDITDAMQATDMEAGIEGIVMQAMREDDDDSDLMPPPEYLGVTLDAMIDDELLMELNERETREVENSAANEADSNNDKAAGAVPVNERQYSTVDRDDDPGDDDIWTANSAYAFQ